LEYLIDNDTTNGLGQKTLPDIQAFSTSLYSLVNTSGSSLENLVRGTDSIGSILKSISYSDVVPSPKNPKSLNGVWYPGGLSLKL